MRLRPFGFFPLSRDRPAFSIVAAAVTLIVAVLTPMPNVLAQTSGGAGAVDERERAFVEGLRRDDPGDADRYVVLRDARNQAIAEVQKVQARYSAAGPELRAVFVKQLRDAQRQYAEASLALLDFLDARERRALTRYQEEIGRINRTLEERARSRAELEKLRQGD